jgi:hypothetical protein
VALLGDLLVAVKGEMGSAQHGEAPWLAGWVRDEAE